MDLKNFDLKLFWGLDTDTFNSTGSKNFKLDLFFDKILLNIFPSQCKIELDCKIASKTVKKDKYNNKMYSYNDAHTFLSWSEIGSEIVTSNEQYNYLRVFDVRNIISTRDNEGNLAYLN